MASASQPVSPRAGAAAGLSCRKSAPGADVGHWSTIKPLHWPCSPDHHRHSVSVMPASHAPDADAPAAPSPPRRPARRPPRGGRPSAWPRARPPWSAWAAASRCPSVLAGAPVFTAEAMRYAAACLLLVALARLTGRRLAWPRGAEWLWLSGIAVTGLVVFNVALVEGSRHAEPAVLGVAVACVPAVLAVAGPLLEGSRPRAAAGGRRPGRTGGAGLVQGAGPHRRHRRGLGRRGLRLRGRVHPAGHPGAGPARPVGGVGARHLARRGDLRRARARPRGPGGGHPADPGGLARRRLPRGRGHRGGLRPVVFQRQAARAPAGPACSPGSPRWPRRWPGSCSAARRPGRWSGRASPWSRPAWPSASGPGHSSQRKARDQASAATRSEPARLSSSYSASWVGRGWPARPR